MNQSTLVEVRLNKSVFDVVGENQPIDGGRSCGSTN